MIKNIWCFIKDNIAVIVTFITAILTVVYTALRFFIYVYWSGYFSRLNIDMSIMNLDFDNSIFSIIFGAIVMMVVLFFMIWVYDILKNIKKKNMECQLKGINRLRYIFMNLLIGVFLSIILLSLVNLPLVMLLLSMAENSNTLNFSAYLFFLLYISEMIFIFIQMNHENYNNIKKIKSKEERTAFLILEVLVFGLIIMAVLFNSGRNSVDDKKQIQLIENEEYMISYYDGEHYILHKVNYDEGKLIIYINEQKIINVENCMFSIKKIEEIEIVD